MRLFAVAYPAMCSAGFGVKIETEERLRKKAQAEMNRLGDKANQGYFDRLDTFLSHSTPGETFGFGDDVIVAIESANGRD